MPSKTRPPSSAAGSRKCSPCTRTRRSSPACPAPERSALPRCWPRSETPAAAIPTPQALAAAAGVCPFTDESGKHRAVGFRYKVDTKLRRALTDFADDSRRASPWAADIYTRARARGMRHPHAARVLARAWTLVIWRCWQDHQPYNHARHGALNRYLNQDAAAAA